MQLVITAWLTVATLLLAATGVRGEGCEDKPHFNYNCWQLAAYCDTPRADAIRNSCPVTCGLCASGGNSRLEKNLDGNPSTTEERNQGPGYQAKRWGDNSRENLGIPGVVSRIEAPVAGPARNTEVGRRIADPDFKKPPQSSVMFAKNSVREPSNSFHDLTDSEAQDKLKGCCSEKGLSSNCISLCTYQITKAEVLSKAIAGSCTLDDARIWVQCASGGRRNSACCRKAGIFGCDGICDGIINGEFGQLLTCVDNYLDPILKCHRNGLSNRIQ